MHTAKTPIAHGKELCRARAHGKGQLAHGKGSFALCFAFAVCQLAFFSFLFYFTYFKTYIDYLNMTNVLHLDNFYTNTYAIR
jgi:hypothetical protein